MAKAEDRSSRSAAAHLQEQLAPREHGWHVVGEERGQFSVHQSAAWSPSPSSSGERQMAARSFGFLAIPLSVRLWTRKTAARCAMSGSAQRAAISF
jgi:hypothetical protein